MTEEIAGTSQDVLAVDLKTAARLLALTEGAVRKQLATGKREGVKSEKGQWEEVLVRSDEIVATEEDDTPETPADHAVALYQELLVEKDRRITSFEDEINFLRQRVQNLEMLLGQSLQNQKALLPPPEEPKAEKPAKRGWFSFGKRD